MGATINWDTCEQRGRASGQRRTDNDDDRRRRGDGSAGLVAHSVSGGCSLSRGFCCSCSGRPPRGSGLVLVDEDAAAAAQRPRLQAPGRRRQLSLALYVCASVVITNTQNHTNTGSSRHWRRSSRRRHSQNDNHPYLQWPRATHPPRSPVDARRAARAAAGPSAHSGKASASI